MRVSVALCTHEGERWIEEQLRSILAQSRPVSEIVVGDDASTDATLDVVRRVAVETDVPIRIRRHDRPLGVAGNFADAIAATSGDVVALSDQDDVWHPDRLERLLPHLDGVAAHDGRGARDEVAALPVPSAWIHDEWLAICAALRGGVRYVPEPTIDYRQHGGNAIGVQRLTLVGKLRRVLEADSGKHDQKAARAEQLATEATRRGLVTGAALERLVEKARHERARAALPDARALRVPGVLRGVVAGRYRRFSRGAADVARDLLERH
jgi:glycosyltransferase involved in cell wall biosynthesis